MSESRELWSTERVRQELGAATIRSAGTMIVRLGLKPVSREPGRSGMNLYEPAEVRAAIASRSGAAEQDQGAALGQTSIASPLNASDISDGETGSDQQLHRCSPDSPALDLKT